MGIPNKETRAFDYTITAQSQAKNDAALTVKTSTINFGTTEKTSNELPNPAELFLGSFAACILKNVERFSELLHFSYTAASIEVSGKRYDRPPRMDSVQYKLTVFSNDKHLKRELLRKNLEKFGTIYNTVHTACAIDGTIEINGGQGATE